MTAILNVVTLILLPPIYRYNFFDSIYPPKINVKPIEENTLVLLFFLFISPLPKKTLNNMFLMCLYVFYDDYYLYIIFFIQF